MPNSVSPSPEVHDWLAAETFATGTTMVQLRFGSDAVIELNRGGVDGVAIACAVAGGEKIKLPMTVIHRLGIISEKRRPGEPNRPERANAKNKMRVQIFSWSRGKTFRESVLLQPP